MVKVVVVFYSLFGHSYKLADSIAQGARSIDGVDDEDVTLWQVEETLSDAAVEKYGATEAKREFAHVPVLTRDKLHVIEEADAIILGGGGRFGTVAAQLKVFIDGLGGLWRKGTLVGKVGSAFCGTATQHGGNEMTILTMLVPLLHLGLMYVGMPYSNSNQYTMDGIEGGSPYGASYVAASDGSRDVSEVELENGCFQGAYVTKVAKALTTGQRQYAEEWGIAGEEEAAGNEEGRSSSAVELVDNKDAEAALAEVTPSTASETPPTRLSEDGDENDDGRSDSNGLLEEEAEGSSSSSSDSSSTSEKASDYKGVDPAKGSKATKEKKVAKPAEKVPRRATKKKGKRGDGAGKKGTGSARKKPSTGKKGDKKSPKGKGPRTAKAGKDSKRKSSVKSDKKGKKK